MAVGVIGRARVVVSRDTPRCRKARKRRVKAGDLSECREDHMVPNRRMQSDPLPIHSSVIFLTHFLTTRPPTVALGQTGRQPGWVFFFPGTLVSRIPPIYHQQMCKITSNIFRRRASDALAPHVYKIKIRISVLEHDPPPSFDLRVIPVSLS